MKTIIWLLSILAFQSANCQTETDSMRKLLAEHRSTIQQKKLIASRLAYDFYLQAKYDSAVKYYQVALGNTKYRSDLPFEGNIQNGLGTSYQLKSQFDSSIVHYKIALRIFIDLKDSANVIAVESNLSGVFKAVALYEESLASAFTVVEALEGKKTSYPLAASYNMIGGVNLRMADFKAAYDNYNKSLSHFSTLKLPAEVARLHNNIGELFILTKNYDSAMHHLNSAAEIKQQLHDKKGLARTLANIGRVSMLSGNPVVAKQQLSEALEIERSIDDPVGLIEVLHSFAEVSIIQDQPRLARPYLGEAERIIQRVGTPEYLRQNLELQIRADRMLNDLSKGMQHLEQLIVIRDSLLNVEKAKSLQAMQIRYDTEKKEQQIALFEQRELITATQLHTNQLMILSLTIGIILFGVIGTLAYINFRNARSAKKKFELLLSETRHRIKNNLQTLASIFNIQAAHYSDHNLIAEAKSAESRVHAMALLHQKFYSVDLSHTLESETFIDGLVRQTVNIYGSQLPDLKLSIDCMPIRLDIEKAVALGLIIHELVCNAFKYAFTDVSQPTLSVTVRKQENTLETKISDNGKGFTSYESSSSTGLTLVNALVEQLNGTLTTVTEKGTTFIVRFPITHQWNAQTS